MRAYIKSSNLLIESLPPQAPSTTSWSPSLSEGGFFVPKFCAKQKIIPQGCTLARGPSRRRSLRYVKNFDGTKVGFREVKFEIVAGAPWR